MVIINNKQTLKFINPDNPAEELVVPVSTEPREVPDWVGKSDMFKLATRAEKAEDRHILEITVKNANTSGPSKPSQAELDAKAKADADAKAKQNGADQGPK